MDTELARTFLAVVTTGSFVNAAERLHVTQSTVSTRIHTLETALGCRLFVRNKGGTTLTPPGKHFQKHASTLVRTVEQARHDVGVARGFRAAVTIGARLGLWEQFLIKRLPSLLEKATDISVRAEIGLESDLMEGLVEFRTSSGMFDLYTRPNYSFNPGTDPLAELLQSPAARSLRALRLARPRRCRFRLRDLLRFDTLANVRVLDLRQCVLEEDDARALAGPESDLWYATVTADFHDRWGAVNDAADFFYPGQPDVPRSSPDELVHHAVLPDELLDLKVASLAAHATQTAHLIELLGPATYREWWRTESFVRAPAAHEHLRIAAADALAA